MKEKTEWVRPTINTRLARWEGIAYPEWVYFHRGTDLKWVNFYSRKVGNTGARAGKIIGDE